MRLCRSPYTGIACRFNKEGVERKMYLIGIDSSTTATKSLIINRDGEIAVVAVKGSFWESLTFQ